MRLAPLISRPHAITPRVPNTAAHPLGPYDVSLLTLRGSKGGSGSSSMERTVLLRVSLHAHGRLSPHRRFFRRWRWGGRDLIGKDLAP